MSPSPRSLIRARQPHCEAWHDCARSVGAWCLIPGGRCIALTHCPSSGDRQHIASISHLTKGFSRKLSDLRSIEGTTWFSTIITQIILFGSLARICLMTNWLLVCRNNLECGSPGAGRYAADQDAPTYRCYLSRLPVSQSGQSLQRLIPAPAGAGITGDGHRVKLMLAACAPDASGDGIDGPLHQSCISPYPQCFQDQAGTTPRTTRNIMGNDRGPSGNPTRYPARTCCSIAPRTSSESAIKGPVTLPGPPVNVAQ
jgi:hypothetical protein